MSNIDQLLERAAVMRAEGKRWKEIAEAVGRDEDTVRHWPLRYAEEWARYRRQVEDEVTAATYNQAVATLEKAMLQAGDEKLRVTAGLALARIRLQQRRLEIAAQRATSRAAAAPPALTDSQRDSAFVDQFTDDQLPQLIRELQPIALRLLPGNDQ
jgi:hypothetical protein